jgi:putative ABC transport system permease protein
MLPRTDLLVTLWDRDADFYRKTEELFARQFGFARGVIIVIIVLTIMNAVTMNVLERTFEVGVMLALGDLPRHVFAVFACEGVLLGLVGGCLGAAGGVLCALVLNAIGIPLPAPPGMSHGFDAGVVISRSMVVTAGVIGFLAASLASLPPAARASRLRPVDALRQGR